jgi:hypothetical protein
MNSATAKDLNSSLAFGDEDFDSLTLLFSD